MTNNTSQHNGGDDQTASVYNVVAVSFDPDTNAYAALTMLKDLDAQQRLSLQAAAVVVRGEDGKIVVKDQVGGDEFAGTAGGGLIGVLVGILGGPLGVLLGGSYGLLVGSLVDVSEVERNESILSQISMSVKPGHTALLAEVTEQSPEVVDTAMEQFRGTVLRRPSSEVEAEIAAAEEAQREAQRKATKELLDGKRQHSKQEVHAKVAQLKAKLPHGEQTASA